MGIKKFAKLLRFASLYHKLVKIADLRNNLATRIMYSAIPAIKAKAIEEKYKGKDDEESLRQKEREIHGMRKEVVEKLSPTILSGASELLKFAKQIIIGEFESYGESYGVPDEESKKIQEQVKSLFNSGDTQEACRIAEEKFLEEGKWAAAYGGKPWANFAKHIGLLDKELDDVSDLTRKREEVLERGGILAWRGSRLEDDYFNACIKISQRVNFIDSLQHNTGSFFSKMIKLDPSIPLKERRTYELTMDELSDAKELQNNEHVLEVLSPYTKNMPDSLKAFMPKDIGEKSDGAEQNLILVRFDRTVGMTFDKVLNTIRSLKISPLDNLTKWQLENVKSNLEASHSLLCCIQALGTVSQTPPEMIRIQEFSYQRFESRLANHLKSNMLDQIQRTIFNKLKDSGITIEAVKNRITEIEKEESNRRMSRQTLPTPRPVPPKPPVPKGPKPPPPPSIHPSWPAKPLQGYDDAFPMAEAKEDDKKIA